MKSLILGVWGLECSCACVLPKRYAHVSQPGNPVESLDIESTNTPTANHDQSYLSKPTTTQATRSRAN
ncbi:hypothetical protein PROFUN_13154 [Planoprotostelium fungivorum]|uniref:Secreted protein n=1 Tax=Planoprotostelium fungivorum TaxID=1890364 RepID=A0A2P6N569_9EUKA|nr:hypothetical protein PROFUN_13154 [Planoprotostelium fungivorum]